jgi:hypothetical protein
MSEPTHEEELCVTSPQAGVLAARVARIRFTGPRTAAM